MLNNISWAGYFYALTLFLFVYYAAILLLYYRSDVLQLFSRRGLLLIFRRGAAHNRLGEVVNSDSQDRPIPETISARAGDHSAQILQAALDELRAYVNQAAQKETCKEELLFSLQGIVRKYPLLSIDPLRQSLNNLIKIQCQNKCSIHLSEEEVIGLWKG